MQKKIDYFQLVKDSFNFTIENKLLWLFGLLITIGGGGMSFNYNFPGSKSSEDKIDEMQLASMMRKFSFFWETYKEWIILGIILLVIILVALYLLGIIGRGALIDSIFKTLKKEEGITFSSGFKKGYHFLGKMFLMNLIFSVAVLVVIAIMAFPIVRLFMLKAYIAGALMSLVAICILISLFVLIFFLSKYAQIYLVSSNIGPVASIKLGYQLFEKNLITSFKMGAVLILVNIVLGMGLFLSIIILGLPFILLLFLSYGILGNVGAAVMGISGGVAVLFLVIFINAVYIVFSQTYLILFFQEIAKENNNEVGESINVVDKIITKNKSLEVEI